MNRMYRPNFITNEQFRGYFTASSLDKILSIGGANASTFLKKCLETGRPVKSIKVDSKTKRCEVATKYKLSHVIIAAKAKGLCVDKPLPPKAARNLIYNIDVLKSEIAALEKQKASLERDIDKLWPYKFTDQQTMSMLDFIKTPLPSINEILSSARKIDNIAGVYFLIKNNEIIYVGQSISVIKRVYKHSELKEFDSFTYLPCDQKNLNVIESLYIHLLEPRENGGSGGSQAKKCAPMSRESLMGMFATDS